MSAISQAQNIITGTVSPASVCPSGTISVPFSATGPFGAGNTFSAQLTDASGSFPATPIVIGTIAANPTSATTLTITATIPANTAVAAVYKVRVVSSIGNKISVSPTTLTIGTAIPTTPVAAPTFCQNTTGSVTATGQNLRWYATASSPTATATGATYGVSTTTDGSFSVYVTQTVNGCESARTQVNYAVTASPAAPAVTPSPDYCINETPALLVATGTNLKWYGTNATGGTATATQLPNTGSAGSTNYYVSQTAGGCESSRALVSVLVKARPAAPGASGISYCVGQTASALTATAANGGTLIWYGTSATGGTASATAPTPPTTTPGTTNYYVSQTLNGCEGPRASITVTINAIPGPPVPNTPPDYCESSAASPLTATGQNLQWYGTNATGGTPTAALTPATNTVGTATYYVSQSINGCESPRAGVTVRVKDSPNAPTVSDVSFCQNSPAPTLTATASTGATLNWYGTNATGGSSSGTAPSPPNGTATTLNYYVSQSLNGCEGPRARLSVVIKPTPATPGTSAIGFCAGQAASALTATAANGGSLNWYGTSATGGTASATAPTPPTTTPGTTNYYVSQTLNGCEGPRASITVTINAIPASPGVAGVGPYCQGASVPALTATGTTGAILQWYGTNATGGTPTATQTPDNSQPGTAAYYVTQTVNGCESPRASITVQIKPTPGSPGVTPVEFCQNTSAPTLTATPIANATLNWYGTNANGPVLGTAPTPPNNTAITLTYYVSQLLDGCESPKAQLSVRVKPTPGLPGTSPAAFCNNAASQPLTASGQNLVWYDQNDTQLGGAPTPNTGSVGTQVFKVTQSQDGCVSNKATVTVTINALPPAPGTSNLQYCLPTQDQPVQNVGQLTANGQNLRWYNPDGNQYGEAPVPPITTTQVIMFQVTQTVNNCEGPKANLQVTIQTTPAPGLPKSVVTYCRNDVATPLEATGTNLRWLDPNNNLLPVNTTPTPPTTNATRPGGVFYQVYQTGSNGCVSPRASIKLIVNTNPTLSILGSTAINLGQTTSLQLRFTGAPPFVYALSNGASGTAATDTIISVPVTPLQTTTYQVVSVSNVCGVGAPGAPATATITVNIPTILTGNLNSSTLCAGSNFTIPFTTQGTFNLTLPFQAQLVQVADTSGRNPINLTASGPDSPLSAAIPLTTPGGRYLVRVVRTVSTTPLIQVVSSSSPTILTVRPLPTATLTGTQNIYEGSPGSLTVTLGGDGPWTFSYADSARIVPVTGTANPYLISVQPLKTTTYRLTTVSNNCGTGAVSGTAVVTVLPLLAVEEDPLSNVVRAYPVPATTSVTVAIDRPLYTESAVLELTDLRGHSVQQRVTRQAKTDLDLSSHPAGLYILTVTVGDKKTTRKILKQ